MDEPRPADVPGERTFHEPRAHVESPAGRRMAFLAEAGRVLSSSLDSEVTLQSVARLAVAEVADFCIVDLVEDDGRVQRVASAHRDPAREDLAEALRRFPPLPGRPGGVPRVLRTGEPEIVAEVTDEVLQAASRDEEHLRILRELGPSSFMIVPLVARGRTLGAILLAYTRSGLRYGPEDLGLTEELAVHAALALDNARLYEDARKEIAERKRTRGELDRQNAFLQLMLEITTAANEAPSFREALRIALDRIRAHTGWPVGHALELVPAGSLESTGLWSTDDPERFRALREVTETVSFLPGIGLPGRVLATGKAVAISDISADPSFLRAYLISDVGVKSAFAFPVRVSAGVVAVLEFFSGRSVEPGPGFLEVMDHVGTQLGRVVERERARNAIRESESLEQEARERAEEAVKARDEVLRMVSHDLKNPIHAITMAAALLADFPLPEEQRAGQVEVIRRTAGHMHRLVQGLLDLKRIEAGHGIPVDLAPAGVAALVEEGCTLFRPQADAKGVEIVRELAGPLPAVRADTERILQVLWNLTGNAIKFTPAGGRVFVRAEERGDEVLFSITDTGPGIAPEHIGRLFDPFWQDKRTARLGTGLGLPISRAIVEAHGGRIWAESTPGRGATFAFTLQKAEASG